MEDMTISQVSRSLGISTRMLRYYEKAGLISSEHREGYSYRVYNERAVSRVKQIVLMRKLRIPVRQIEQLLNHPDAAAAIEIFQRNMEEVDGEIEALHTIREILSHFVEELGKERTVETLTLPSLPTREVHAKMEDVRIITLPPASVAASHCVGEEPESRANALIDDFVRTSGLVRMKPDLRRYGFNHPNPVDETGYHGYEAWVTVPDGMEVPAPLEKKRFGGGLYAAHMIPFGSFNEWDALLAWAMESDRFEFAGDLRDQEHMCGLMEEHLNYVGHIARSEIMLDTLQLDLLMPVREKEEQR